MLKTHNVSFLEHVKTNSELLKNLAVMLYLGINLLLSLIGADYRNQPSMPLLKPYKASVEIQQSPTQIHHKK